MNPQPDLDRLRGYQSLAAHQRVQAVVARKQGRLDDARQLYRGAADYFQLAGEHRWAAQALLELAEVESQANDPQGAYEVAFQASVEAALANDKIRIDQAVRLMCPSAADGEATVIKEAA